MNFGLRDLCILVALSLGVAGCSSTAATNAPPSELSDASLLRQETQGSSAWVYRAPDVDLRQYTSFVIEPVEVYRGPEADFANLSAADLTELTRLIASETSSAISPTYPVVTQPGQGTARLKMTLVDVESTVGGVATVSRILPIGAVANVVKGAAGGSGSFTGSILVATEVFDAATGELVAAAVRRYNPAVFDIRSTLSTMDTARSSVREMAKQHRDAIDRVHAG